MPSLNATDSVPPPRAPLADPSVDSDIPVSIRIPLVAAVDRLENNARYRHLRLRNNEDITALRRYFGVVRIVSVTLEGTIYSGGGRRISIGVLPGNANAPASGPDVLRYPGVRVFTSDSRTASQFSVTFDPVTAPGIEWDLAREPIRFGHPVIFSGWTGALVAPAQGAAGDIVVAMRAVLIVEIGGSTSGAPVGGDAVFQ